MGIAGYMNRLPTFRDDVLDRFNCSILGNYRHLRHLDRPPSVKVRLRLYEIRYQQPERLTQLFFSPRGSTLQSSHYSVILASAIRENVVWMIDDDPALRAQFNTLVDWELFQKATIEIMNELRRLIYKAIEEDRLFSFSKTDDAGFVDDAIETACVNGHDRILALRCQARTVVVCSKSSTSISKPW